MALTPPAPRELMHSRHTVSHGYRRADGLWDIEGTVQDTKSYPFDNQHLGEVTPGTPYHDMAVRVTIDEDFIIRDIEVQMAATPYHICAQIAPEFSALRGVSMMRGFRKELYARMGGVHGCTHVVELLAAMATTAFQTIMPLRHRSREFQESGRKPKHIGTCYALREDGEVVRDQYPQWYTGERDEG